LKSSLLLSWQTENNFVTDSGFLELLSLPFQLGQSAMWEKKLLLPIGAKSMRATLAGAHLIQVKCPEPSRAWLDWSLLAE